MKNGLGGGTYEWKQAVKKLGSGRKAGSTVCSIPLHPTLIFDLLLLSAGIGIRKEELVFILRQ